MEKIVRPWGHMFVLLSSPTCKVKEIHVNPLQRLSYQYHQKRSEHWFIVSGVATVTLDDVEYTKRAGDSVDVALLQKHRVANFGNEPMVFIEIQTGTYFGEDDIVRIEDDYKRT
ncbi:MAG: mannose-6-phosphate isomerase [Candidatus Magasanikbacteria bacterium CG11_big_fil_rev_8_21_14_0_20_39_34]|uniref:Mannose-6-phosphate isomerase n=1 Tax=Candidatus Magasanikbacteria bacterium CG11_big_fil_rev_8_21_14_0_20_39_34 TaxID=1974653 RepID=A0A2H0N663_9BACT|nr:MAG: mannose-6-phosphate isomerase [Candidatus Magasanikbacteria bacterium CG11_big_fil_rev_8_21_14_0_20_39_34]